MSLVWKRKTFKLFFSRKHLKCPFKVPPGIPGHYCIKCVEFCCNSSQQNLMLQCSSQQYCFIVLSQEQLLAKSAAVPSLSFFPNNGINHTLFHIVFKSLSMNGLLLLQFKYCQYMNESDWSQEDNACAPCRPAPPAVAIVCNPVQECHHINGFVVCS